MVILNYGIQKILLLFKIDSFNISTNLMNTINTNYTMNTINIVKPKPTFYIRIKQPDLVRINNKLYRIIRKKKTKTSVQAGE